jgi:hypothetical protein
MSHFYNRKSYTFSETDEMMLDIKKEMSNFLTKEEAELILNRRYALIDPPPFRNNEINILQDKVYDLERKLQSALYEIDKLKNIKKHSSP